MHVTLKDTKIKYRREKGYGIGLGSQCPHLKGPVISLTEFQKEGRRKFQI